MQFFIIKNKLENHNDLLCLLEERKRKKLRSMARYSHDGQHDVLVTLVSILIACLLLFLLYRIIIHNLIAYYFLMTCVTFIAFYIDKGLSQSRSRRISESVLLVLSTVGGWLGSVLAIAVLRHKSRKATFLFLTFISIVVNICVLRSVIM